jgi:hypothetical protein
MQYLIYFEEIIVATLKVQLAFIGAQVTRNNFSLSFGIFAGHFVF